MPSLLHVSDGGHAIPNQFSINRRPKFHFLSRLHVFAPPIFGQEMCEFHIDQSFQIQSRSWCQNHLCQRWSHAISDCNDEAVLSCEIHCQWFSFQLRSSLQTQFPVRNSNDKPNLRLPFENVTLIPTIICYIYHFLHSGRAHVLRHAASSAARHG